MSKELAQKYNHLEVEKDRYQEWLKEGYFTAGDKSKDRYCIVIPPPNVTGKLRFRSCSGIRPYKTSLLVISV